MAPDLYELVHRLRPRWLDLRSPQSFESSTEIVVFEGQSYRGGVEVLRQFGYGEVTAGDVLAKRLAILRQDNHIAARLTVRELVTFGRYPHCKGRPTAADHDFISRAIAHLGLQAIEERFLDELSGGQRQRAFVAMVFAQDTDYVLLDEPLNNLDMCHAVAMMRQLRHAADELKKTIVIVVHDLNFASCYSDHIVAMRDGKVVFYGTPDQLLVPAVLKQIYDLDIAVHRIGKEKIALYYR